MLGGGGEVVLGCCVDERKDEPSIAYLLSEPKGRIE